MRVLIIEDEVDLALAVQQALREEGYACDVAYDGVVGLSEAVNWDYDLVVLDLMLPGLDGPSVLRRLREEKPTPVLVFSARDAVGDKVGLLDAGADDFLSKPFELDELLARVRALIRRAANQALPAVEIRGHRVDLARREVLREGKTVALTPKAFALVEYLVLHRGTIISRTRIYEHIYDDREDTRSNVVDVYISNIRRKLGRDFVRTRRGEGYIVDG